MADIVRVTNLGSEDFKGAFNSQPFTIPAGGDAIIDREAAIIWFGDWTVRNLGTEQKHQFRRMEVERLKGLYGSHYDDPRDDPRIPAPLYAQEKWAQNKPFVKIEETDGTKVITILEDESGSTLPIADAPAHDVAAAVAAMQDQIIKLQDAVAEAQGAAVKAPTDSPERGQRKRGPVAVDAMREADG